jgi:hypothetical protein
MHLPSTHMPIPKLPPWFRFLKLLPTAFVGIMETLKGLLQSDVPLPPLLPATEPESQPKLHSIVTHVVHSIKLNFVDTLHKNWKRDYPTPESCLASSEPQRVTVTPTNQDSYQKAVCSICFLSFFRFGCLLRRYQCRNISAYVWKPWCFTHITAFVCLRAGPRPTVESCLVMVKY